MRVRGEGCSILTCTYTAPVFFFVVVVVVVVVVLVLVVVAAVGRCRVRIVWVEARVK